MNIQVNVPDIEAQVLKAANEAISRELTTGVNAVLANLDINKLVVDRITYHIDRSKYVTDSIIKNLVQQKIAREIANKIIKGE